MLSSERRVVITGLGIVSPIGVTPDAVWTALEEGKGAVQPLQAFQVEGLPTSVGAEVLGFDLKKSAHIKDKTSFRKNLKYMARDIQLAVGAAQLAMADAGFKAGELDPTRFGIDLGAGLISSELDELAPAISHSSAADGHFDYRRLGPRGDPGDPALLAAQVSPQHAGLSYLDHDGLPGAEQHDHRGRCRLGAGAW